MPNGGFYGTTEEWLRIEAPLREIDQILASFARKHNLKLEKNYHNWPNRRIKWETDEAWRCIQITLAEEADWTYAYVDLFAEKGSEKKHIRLVDLSPWLSVRETISELLVQGHKTLQEWPG